MSPTGTYTVTETATPTPLMKTVTVKIYNAAGEVVRELPSVLVPETKGKMRSAGPDYGTGRVSYDPGTGRLRIAVGFEGGEYETWWDGRNNAGVEVDSGEYLMKAETEDGNGVVTITAPVIVAKKVARLTIRIYTASGELVRSLADISSVSGRIASVELEGDPLRLGPGQANLVKIMPKGSGPTDISDSRGSLSGGRIVWDGKGDGGWLVQSGEYILKLEQVIEGDKITITRSITVVRYSGGDTVAIGVYPNPYHGEKGDGFVRITVRAVDQTEASVRIYNVAGEMVGNIPGTVIHAGTTEFKWKVSSMASGVYVGLVETKSLITGTREKKVVKIVIVK
jgi:flagellar hook assembly protein FlgD